MYTERTRAKPDAPRREDDIGDPDAEDDNDNESAGDNVSAIRPPAPPSSTDSLHTVRSHRVLPVCLTADPRYLHEHNPDPFVRPTTVQPRRTRVSLYTQPQSLSLVRITHLSTRPSISHELEDDRGAASRSPCRPRPRGHIGPLASESTYSRTVQQHLRRPDHSLRAQRREWNIFV